MGLDGDPHNNLFIHTFSQLDLARSFFEYAIGKTNLVDYSTIRLEPTGFIDERLKKSQCDLLYRIGGTEAAPVLVHFLLEHQSTYDRWLPFRMLEYSLQVWAQWRKENPRERYLPQIVPLCIYHGLQPWEYEGTDDLIEEPLGMPEYARPYYHPLVYSLPQVKDQTLAQMTVHPLVRLTCLVLKHCRSKLLGGLLLEWTSLFRDVIVSQGAVALTALTYYLLSSCPGVAKRQIERLGQELGKDGVELMALPGTVIDQAEKRVRGECLAELKTMIYTMVEARYGTVAEDWQEKIESVTSIPDARQLLAQLISANTPH